MHELFTAGAVLLRDALVDALDVEGALVALKRARSPESELQVDRENLLRILRRSADLNHLLVGRPRNAPQTRSRTNAIVYSRYRAQLELAVVLQTPEEGRVVRQFLGGLTQLHNLVHALD